MSFQDNRFHNGNIAQYCGPLAGATPVQLGELQFRYRPGASALPEVAMIAGTKQWEAYFIESYGAGATLAYNFNATPLTTAWTLLDVDGLTLTDGSDRQDILLTPTDNNDGVLYRVMFWLPTSQKAIIYVEMLDPSKGLVLNDPTQQLAIHHHRFNAGDNPNVSNFNGQTYKWDEWVPAITGNFMNVGLVGTYTNHGLNFRKNAAGNCELYGDAPGVVESWVVDLKFVKFPTGTITRFGY